ncbi:MAG: diguanylate cyclase [Sphaerochaeta sp.]
MHKRMLAAFLLLLVLNTLAGEPLPSLDRGVENAIHPMILVEGKNNTILYANPACADYFSIPRERLVGRSFPALIKVECETLPALHEQLVSMDKETGEVVYFQVGVQDVGTEESPRYMIMLQDRSKEQQLITQSRFMNWALGIAMLLVLIFLILLLALQVRLTRRLKNEKSQQERSLSLLKQFLNADNRYSYIKDADGRFLVVNENLCQFLGYPEKEILGKSIAEVSNPAFAAFMDEHDQKAVEAQVPLVQENQWDGRMYHTTKFPLLLPGGTIGLGALVLDVTERRHQEQILKDNLERAAKFSQLLSSSIKNPTDKLETALNMVCVQSGSALALLLLINESTASMRIIRTGDGKDHYHIPLQGSIPIPESILERYKEQAGENSFFIVNEERRGEPLLSYLANEETTIQRMLACICKVDDEPSGILILADCERPYRDAEGFQFQLLFSGIWANVLKAEKEHALQASQKSLRLILDSTAEGIFGTNAEGLCTFCNASCLRLLGYTDERELLGRNMHQLVHHSTKEGIAIEEATCPIRSSLVKGVGLSIESEGFWRKDGSWFAVLCYSYPQMQDGNVIGSVITFLDNTERQQNLEKIAFLSFHDQLTGLYNRSYADEAMIRLDTEEHFPLSIIIGDVNGLKLTNDIFGHTSGDRLLITIAKCLRTACRTSDMVSRIGGDEFLLLLPRTDSEEADEIIKRIEGQLEKERVEVGKRSISLGSATKTAAQQTIQSVFDQAEDQMYRRKTLRRAETQKQQLQRLREMLWEKAPSERHHAMQVKNHAAHLAELLGLNDEEKSRLMRAGFYHDIGKVVLDPALIIAKKRDALMQKNYQEHVSAGYRILNMFSETVDLAPLVLHHHEWWDGSGYLKGLKGAEIPFYSRILRLAEVWEREHLDLATPEKIKEVLRELAGIEVDPYLVERIINAL